MVDEGKIHTTDIGNEFEMLVEDTNSTGTANSVVDLSQVDGTEPLWVIFTDPDGTEYEFEAEILNAPGTDGYLVYITENAIFADKPGFWKKRPRIIYADGKQYDGLDKIFEVLK